MRHPLLAILITILISALLCGLSQESASSDDGTHLHTENGCVNTTKFYFYSDYDCLEPYNMSDTTLDNNASLSFFPNNISRNEIEEPRAVAAANLE